MSRRPGFDWYGIVWPLYGLFAFVLGLLIGGKR